MHFPSRRTGHVTPLIPSALARILVFNPCQVKPVYSSRSLRFKAANGRGSSCETLCSFTYSLPPGYEMPHTFGLNDSLCLESGRVGQGDVLKRKQRFYQHELPQPSEGACASVHGLDGDPGLGLQMRIPRWKWIVTTGLGSENSHVEFQSGKFSMDGCD